MRLFHIGDALKSNVIKLISLLKSGGVTSSSLLSKPEQDYFNYFLNKSAFTNGPDLRNKYSHTQPHIREDKNHQRNYFIALRLLIVLIIKINDEFCELSLT